LHVTFQVPPPPKPGLTFDISLSFVAHPVNPALLSFKSSAISEAQPVRNNTAAKTQIRTMLVFLDCEFRNEFGAEIVAGEPSTAQTLTGILGLMRHLSNLQHKVTCQRRVDLAIWLDRDSVHKNPSMPLSRTQEDHESGSLRRERPNACGVHGSTEAIAGARRS
jgi:hypothetical protein